MNKLYIISFLILLSNSSISQIQSFKKFKAQFSHNGCDGVVKSDFEIIKEKNKLYLVESHQQLEIESFKLGYIIDFINEVKKQADSCQGIDWAGPDQLQLDIDNQKIVLKNCSTDEVNVNKFIIKLKKGVTKLKEDITESLHWEISDLIDNSLNNKLKGCWNINKDFKMKPNAILVLSKDKINDAYQWCFKDGNLKTTIQNDLLYQSKLTKEDSLDNSPNGIWFVDFNTPKNSTVPKVHLSHNRYLGWYDEDLDDIYNYKPLKFIFSIIEFKENLVILQLIDQKKNADNEYNSNTEEK